MLWLLIVILIVLAIAGLPSWPYAANWNAGYAPTGVISILVIILLVLLLTGRLG